MCITVYMYVGLSTDIAKSVGPSVLTSLFTLGPIQSYDPAVLMSGPLKI